MQRLEVSGAVRPIYGSLGFKRLMHEKVWLSADKTAQPSTLLCALAFYELWWQWLANLISAVLALQSLDTARQLSMCVGMILCDKLVCRGHFTFEHYSLIVAALWTFRQSSTMLKLCGVLGRTDTRTKHNKLKLGNTYPPSYLDSVSVT